VEWLEEGVRELEVVGLNPCGPTNLDCSNDNRLFFTFDSTNIYLANPGPALCICVIHAYLLCRLK
jgi:hypothetical protein